MLPNGFEPAMTVNMNMPITFPVEARSLIVRILETIRKKIPTGEYLSK